GEVGVDVRAGNPRLGPLRRSVPDDAEPASAVVVPPRERRRRPAPGDEALVRVDRRREEDRQLARTRDLTRQELRDHSVVRGERVPPLMPEAGVDVTRRAALLVVGLGHKGDRASLLVGDLLGAVLVDDVVVGGAQRVGEAEVDLVLTGAGLALRTLDAQSRLL